MKNFCLYVCIITICSVYLTKGNAWQIPSPTFCTVQTNEDFNGYDNRGNLCTSPSVEEIPDTEPEPQAEIAEVVREDTIAKCSEVTCNAGDLPENLGTDPCDEEEQAFLRKNRGKYYCKTLGAGRYPNPFKLYQGLKEDNIDL